MARKKKTEPLTREQAIAKLAETRTLSTELLAPLGIKFDSFLTLSQRPKAEADAIVAKLIANLTA